MPNIKKVARKVGVFFVVGIQLVYFIGYHQKITAQKKMLTREINEARKELSSLKELSKVEDLEQELQVIKKKLYPYTVKIPFESKDVCDVTTLFKIASQYPFKEVTLNEIEKIERDEEGANLVQNKYVISYLSEPTVSKRFIKNFIQSTQLIKLDKVEFRPCIQMENNKLIETLLVFSTFTKKKL